MIYLASSWRNKYYPGVLNDLQDNGFNVYDFRAGPSAFKWAQVDIAAFSHPNKEEWTFERYITALQHPRAEEGFQRDSQALHTCSTLILVCPSGRSAHLELGIAIGRGIPTIIYMPEDQEPELMYLETTILTNKMERVLEEAASCERFQPI